MLALALGIGSAPPPAKLSARNFSDSDLNEGLQTLLVRGHHYFLSPDGLPPEFGTGSREHPFTSWESALSPLTAGDTLILLDGDYRGLGTPRVNCAQPSASCPRHACANGTTDGPITIRAESEGRAVLHSSASSRQDAWNALTLESCAHWTLSGLQFIGSDNREHAPARSHVVLVADSANIRLQRLQLLNSNRHSPGALLGIDHSRDILVEESQFQQFLGYGIRATGSEKLEIRRNYLNCGRYAGIAPVGGITPPGKDCFAGGLAVGIGLSPARRSLLENNIVENTPVGYEILETESGNASEVRLLGNAAFNVATGVTVANRSGSQQDILLHDQFVARARETGIAAVWGGVRDLVCQNCTVLGDAVARPSWAYFVLNGSPFKQAPLRRDATFRLVNSLSIDAGAAVNYDYGARGPVATGYADCRVTDSVLASRSPASAIPRDCQGGFTTADPNLGVPPGSQVGLGEGQCPIRIPEGNFRLSKMGAELDDIGANLDHRYENGLLVPRPLWENGRFPCGPDLDPALLVDAENRCARVHLRLKIASCL